MYAVPDIRVGLPSISALREVTLQLSNGRSRTQPEHSYGNGSLARLDSSVLTRPLNHLPIDSHLRLPSCHPPRLRLATHRGRSIPSRPKCCTVRPTDYLWLSPKVPPEEVTMEEARPAIAGRDALYSPDDDGEPLGELTCTSRADA